MLESLTDQILKSDVIPIVTEKELEVECCVRGHHVHESNWDAKTGSKLKPCHERRPSALVEDKYAMALKFNDTTVGHVPKFLSNITFSQARRRSRGENNRAKGIFTRPRSRRNGAPWYLCIYINGCRNARKT